MAAAMTKGRRHCITLDPHRRANSLGRAGTQAGHHRIHTAGSTQTRAPAGAQAGMHTRRRGWRGARAPGPIPGARPTQARRRRRIRTAGPTQARRRGRGRCLDPRVHLGDLLQPRAAGPRLVDDDVAPRPAPGRSRRRDRRNQPPATRHDVEKCSLAAQKYFLHHIF